MLHIKLKGIMNAAAWEQFFSHRPPISLPWTLEVGLKYQNYIFSEHGQVTYQINGTHEMQQHGRKCFARRSPNTLGDGFEKS